MKQIIATDRVPIKLWLNDIEPGALAQARNLANLPFVFKHIAIMPDAHQGYGVPIGGVMVVDHEGNCIDPACPEGHGLNQHSVDGDMTTEYICPACGKEPVAWIGIMQGGANCVCRCGTKFHVCAF